MNQALKKNDTDRKSLDNERERLDNEREYLEQELKKATSSSNCENPGNGGNQDQSSEFMIDKSEKDEDKDLDG